MSFGEVFSAALPYVLSLKVAIMLITAFGVSEKLVEIIYTAVLSGVRKREW